MQKRSARSSLHHDRLSDGLYHPGDVHPGRPTAVTAVMSLVTWPVTAQHHAESQDHPVGGKRQRSGSVRGPPLQSPAPLQGRCTLVGHLGHSQGLYVNCQLEGQPCRALVDTGSTISLVRPGVLLGTTGPLSAAWSPTNTQVTTVTGEKADMRGKGPLRVHVGDQELVHEFWLANIRDPCIIGLDLLTRWGACVNVSGAAITFGTETVALQSSREKTDQRTHRQAAAAQRTPAPCDSRPQPHRPPSKLAAIATSTPTTSCPASPLPPSAVSAETTGAIRDL